MIQNAVFIIPHAFTMSDVKKQNLSYWKDTKNEKDESTPMHPACVLHDASLLHAEADSN